MKSTIQILGWLVFIVIAQPAHTQGLVVSFIRPYHITLTTNKTTNLIFPGEITGVDRGSTDILVQKAAAARNILQLKAVRVNFPQTNLSVVTAGGRLFSFLVDYAADPPELTIEIRDSSPLLGGDSAAGEVPVLLTGRYQEQELLGKVTPRILEAAKNIYGETAHHDQVKFSLNGLYIDRDRFYFRFCFRNASALGFDIRGIRFFKTDRQRSRRIASQETELDPLAVYLPDSTVAAWSEDTCIVALPSFTLSDNRVLKIAVTEKNGGRGLWLRMVNSGLLLARPLSAAE